MNPETQEASVQSGWIDETNIHREQVSSFFKEYSHNSDRLERQYGTELHFSGGNMDVREEIYDGNAEIERIDSLYENGELSKMHIIFSAHGKDQNMDAYLSGQALADYLAGLKE
jgi:hypothetical protein